MHSSINTVAEDHTYLKTCHLTHKLLGLTMVQPCASVVGSRPFAVGLVTGLLIIKYKCRFVNYNVHRTQSIKKLNFTAIHPKIMAINIDLLT